MTGNERTPLNVALDDDDLGDFKPQKRSRAKRQPADFEGAFPSREAPKQTPVDAPRDQLNIRVLLSSKKRFQGHSKRTGLKQHALFEQLLDAWEEKHGA